MRIIEGRLWAPGRDQSVLCAASMPPIRRGAPEYSRPLQCALQLGRPTTRGSMGTERGVDQVQIRGLDQPHTEIGRPRRQRLHNEQRFEQRQIAAKRRVRNARRATPGLGQPDLTGPARASPARVLAQQRTAAEIALRDAGAQLYHVKRQRSTIGPASVDFIVQIRGHGSIEHRMRKGDAMNATA